MSASVHERPIDLGTGVSRPLVIATVGLGLLVLAAPVALYLLASPPTVARNDPAPAQRGPAWHGAQARLLPAPSEPYRVIEQGAAEPDASETLKPVPPPVVKQPALASVDPLPTIVPSKPVPPAAPVAATVAAPLELATAARAPSPYEVVAEAKQTPWPFKRRFPFTEDDLRYQLNTVARDVDLETEKGATEALMKENSKAVKAAKADARSRDAADKPAKTEPALDLLARRDDLKGLPVRNRAECELGAKEVTAMLEVSAEVRGVSVRKRSANTSGGDESAREAAIADLLEKKAKSWRDDVSIRVLTQMVQGENRPVRDRFLKIMSATKGKAAATALAQRAVFDLSPEVREAAIAALKDRPREEYRSVLLEALRYPWAPVADHAAEALVALVDGDATLDLAFLLDKPDPLAPTQDKDKKWVVPELVRMNHMGNCLLCHAPASGGKDQVLGLVPERGKPPPPAYYEGRSGDFVRADVTYIKQDFSVVQSVANAYPWPYLQRFDYLVRIRELSADELERLRPQRQATDKPNSYPQREAVLWALRHLTGEDRGDKSEDWYDLLLPGCGAAPDL